MPSVLVVGARSGLGQALASVYQERGWSVCPVDRDTCDLSNRVAVAQLAERLRSPGSKPDVFVFSAGASEAGYVDELDDQAFRHCFQVNFFAPVALFQAAATGPVSCRRFVFVLSGAADFLVPGLSPYALSKRALRDYLNVVRLERSFPQCRILAVWPGPIETSFNAKTRLHGQYRLLSPSRARPARDVAERIYEAERSGREQLVLSATPLVLGRVQSLVPSLTQWLVRHHRSFRRPCPK